MSDISSRDINGISSKENAINLACSETVAYLHSLKEFCKLGKKMVGKVEHELEVNVPASELWEIYGGLELAYMVTKLLPDIFESVEVVEGDGGVGTVLKVIPKGIPSVTYFKEKIIVIDNEKRLKVTELVEGGFLDLGFSLFQVYLQIVEKDSKLSIIKSTIEYEVEPGFEANASFVSIQPLQLAAEAIGKYLTEKA